jgi:hypothetical protein
MPFDAVATRPTTLTALSRERWLTLLTSSRELCLTWMASIARRLDDDRRRMAVLTTRPLDAQVAYLLLEQQEPREDGVPCVRLTHAVLAQLLGAGRQSVTRVMHGLRRDGLIQSRYGCTALLDVPGLERLAGTMLPAAPGPGPQGSAPLIPSQARRWGRRRSGGLSSVWTRSARSWPCARRVAHRASTSAGCCASRSARSANGFTELRRLRDELRAPDAVIDEIPEEEGLVCRIIEHARRSTDEVATAPPEDVLTWEDFEAARDANAKAAQAKYGS